jgi:HSP20 family protein
MTMFGKKRNQEEVNERRQTMAENTNLEPTKEEMELSEGAERTRPRRVFVPRATIYEHNDEITILVDMPGVQADNIDIVMEKNELKIGGMVTHEAPEGYSLVYSEYSVGDYERSFVLPRDIDREKIEASMKDGVLTVKLQRAEAYQARKIDVKAIE